MRKHYSERSPILLRAILILMLLAVPFQWGFAQITLSTRHETLETVVKQIKSQSKYQFFYNDNMASMKLNAVKVKNASIETTLNKLLEGKSVTYKIVGDV